MLKALMLSWWGWLQLGARLMAAIGAHGLWAIPGRILIFIVAWPLFGLLLAMHWIGFLADEIFFRRYRDVSIVRPIFIVGLPRSGTTFLQRALGEDDAITTLTMFESVIAPSITERRFWSLVAFPFRKLTRRTLFAGMLSRLDHIHELRLDEPEEDFLLLLMLQACFLLVVLCPGSSHYWKLARFDDAFSPTYRATVMTFYRRCIQKHLYCHGEHKRFLSKNPSFTPFMRSLAGEFVDARIIGCIRAPERVVPSQLSSLLPAFRLFGDGRLPPGFQECMVAVLHEYCERLEAGDLLLVEMQALNRDLDGVVAHVFEYAQHDCASDYHDRLSRLVEAARHYESGHGYSLDDFGITEGDIAGRFDPVWRELTRKNAWLVS